jgi:ABC-type branched-subunit amino acid transport system ATPase component/branched-subunit amino acid ABC-type transport system permease component
LLPYIIAGLTTGSVYSLGGVGLVLTYRTSGLFNFAHGALATVAAYLFYTLHVQHGMPWPLAAVICVFVAGPILGLLFERIARIVAVTSLATRVASTVGVLLVVQAVAVVIYGTSEQRKVPPFLPVHPYEIGGTFVTMDRIIVFATGALATIALYVYLRLTRMGVAMRAVVDDQALLDVAGTNPVVVRRWAWMIGVALASASGLLLTPFLYLDATSLTFLVVAAYGAAALGSFKSLPGTYLGGLAIGVAAALASKYFTSGLLSGLSASLPFLALFVVLLISPRRRLAERAPIVPRGNSGWTTPWQVQSTLGAGLLLLLCFVPSFASIHLADYSRFLSMTVLFLSLGLLVRTSGQVSLCHVTFMVIGVCGFSHLATDHHWPWGVALITAGLIAVPIGALLAIPAIRLSGLYLALATFGFGLLVQYMFYSESYMFGVTGIIAVPMPTATAIGLNGSDKSYYYLCLVFALIALAAVVGITRSRLGRLLRALADSPTGLATNGTSVNITRVLVFCISAFLAAVAGILEAGATGQASGASYQPLVSLIYFALIVISVGGVPWYAVGAAAAFVIFPSYVTSANTANWLQVVFGASAILFAITPAHLKGVHPAVRSALDRLVRRPGTHPKPTAADATSAGTAAEPAARTAAEPLAKIEPGALQVDGVRVAFGGLVALDGVSLEVPTGRITGLIGPNGAGKTTLFNACSGLERPGKGSITLDRHDISRLTPSGRARRGLGRTFQQMELFDSLSVWENVALGAEAKHAGINAFQHLMSLPSTARNVRRLTENALRQCALLPLADRQVGSLSTGQRRLVELARALAGQYRILLLDEPSSGLDRTETARFGEILTRVVAQRGLGILLVEHDMTLVTAICGYIYVLDFGKPIFEGTAPEVLSSPIVQGAYLGESEIELAELGASIPEGETVS